MQKSPNYKILIDLARSAILAELNNSNIDSELLNTSKKFDLKKGVFVTIYKNGVLRGCIGQLIPLLPLWQAVIELSKSAAFHDSRFNPITRNELPYIFFEISVLSPLNKLNVSEPKDYLELINPRKQGIFIESKDHQSGVLLPQVFLERNITDPKKALQMTCQKANLPQSEWKKEKTSIYVFTVNKIKEIN